MFSPRGGADITGETQVDRKPCRAKDSEAVGEEELGCDAGPRGRFQAVAAGLPSGYLSGYSQYRTQIPTENYLCKTVAIIRVYLEWGRENNPAACPRRTGPLSKCLQNK